VNPVGDVTRDMGEVETALREAIPSYEELGGGRPWAWLTTLLR
jgi:hypothetical protein